MNFKEHNAKLRGYVFDEIRLIAGEVSIVLGFVNHLYRQSPIAASSSARGGGVLLCYFIDEKKNKLYCVDAQ